MRGAGRLSERELFERERELDRISAGLSSALASSGAVQVVKGPPGIGKTSLCEATHDLALAAGLMVLKATGSVVEHDFSYGVVRQLFEPLVHGRRTRARTGLFRGPTRAAGLVVLGRGAISEGGRHDADGFYAVLHGLFSLTVELAAERPLVLIVDDAHWADPASQRFLLHLARRIERLPILLFVAIGDGKRAEETTLLSDLVGLEGVTVLRPAALSEEAVGRMVRAALGRPDRVFVSACYRATGGVPYFVRELVSSLFHDMVRPTASEAARVAEVGPATIAHATLLRLGRLGGPARAVARAVSVLGSRATVPLIAALASLDREETLAAVDTLVEAGIFAAGSRLCFADPILGTSVYEDLAAGTRESMHLRAAELLIEQDADPEDAAAHLLATSTGSAAHAVGCLEAAARQALARGAPESAMSYLRRLVEETSGGERRASALHELGRAEMLVRDPRAAEHLREAMGASARAVTRARIACDLADVLGATGFWEARIPLLATALDELAPSDLEVRLELERRQAGLEAYDTRYVAEFDRREPELRALVETGHPAGRELTLLLAAVAAWRCRSLDEVRSLVQRGLDGGRLLKERGSSIPSLSQAVGALVLTEQIEAARSLVDAMLEDAERRGSLLGSVQARICLVWVRAQVGDLTGVEEDLRGAIEVAGHVDDLLGTVCALRFGLDALLERPGLADLADMARNLAPGPGWEHTLTGGFLCETRGHLRLVSGERQEGIEDLRTAGTIYERLGVVNPVMARWRSALAIATGGRAGEVLASAELAKAEASGYPRALSSAYRTTGLLRPGPSGLELLEKALAEAQRCPSQLEVARCQIDLGAALRRAGRRVSARPVLTTGMRLAESCGAESLAGRAREELRLAGAKPRWRRLSGVGSLTPAEDRVARLASEGKTNREIALLQFVSPKTVENQLGQIYRKLGINGRGELRKALREQEPID